MPHNHLLLSSRPTDRRCNSPSINAYTRSTPLPLPSIPSHPTRRRQSLACLRLLVELRTSRTRLEFESNSRTILAERGRRGGEGGTGIGVGVGAGGWGGGRKRVGDFVFLSWRFLGSNEKRHFMMDILVDSSPHRLDCFGAAALSFIKHAAYFQLSFHLSLQIHIVLVIARALPYCIWRGTAVAIAPRSRSLLDFLRSFTPTPSPSLYQSKPKSQSFRT